MSEAVLPKKSISFSISLPQWLVDLLDCEMEREDIDSRSFLIQTALKAYLEGKYLAESRSPDFWKQQYRKRMEESCE
jgi:metal-responsive CopG/Arc/MetJ family transcriptional regulator